MVHIIRKAVLPDPAEVSPHLREIAAQALVMKLREPKPLGFPLLFSNDQKLVEPVVAFLHEYSVQRAHTVDTLRTYSEILYDWFDTLEQNSIPWDTADAVNLAAYRNRMMVQPSPHTGRPYKVSTINHRVRGVLRFYSWAVKRNWLSESELSEQKNIRAITSHSKAEHQIGNRCGENSQFTLRQFVSLPKPLSSPQVRELLANLSPPYDLMARWQIYTGVRVSELLRLTKDIGTLRTANSARQYTIEILRKGRKQGHIIASESLLAETENYLSLQRYAWISRAHRRGVPVDYAVIFVNTRGRPVSKSSYQRVIAEAGIKCGFKVTTHLLRATFACMLLSRLESLAARGYAINPLLVVKILMGHERLETTDRYLRAIAVDYFSLKDVLENLLSDSYD